MVQEVEGFAGQCLRVGEWEWELRVSGGTGLCWEQGWGTLNVGGKAKHVGTDVGWWVGVGRTWSVFVQVFSAGSLAELEDRRGVVLEGTGERG